MKTLRSAVILFLWLGFMTLPMAVLFAQGDNSESEAKPVPEIAKLVHSDTENKALLDAATALRASRPDLADRLVKYAESEAKEKTEWNKLRSEEKGLELIGEKDGIKLLQDSISLLKGSNPDLANSLNNYLDKETNEIKTEK